jgi:hypothetical protein
MNNWCLRKKDSLDEKTIHFHCTQCNSHYYIDRWYTKDEWFFYINEMTYAQWVEQREASYESLHAHELVNHSDPE